MLRHTVLRIADVADQWLRSARTHGPLDGFATISELELYVSENTPRHRNRDRVALRQEMRVKGSVWPVVVALYQDGTLPEILEGSEYIEIAKELYGPTHSIPIVFLYLTAPFDRDSMVFNVNEAYSVEEIAELWRGGIRVNSSDVHGHWRVRELEPYADHTVKSKLPADEIRRELEDGQPTPVRIVLYRNGTLPRIISDPTYLKIAAEMFGRGYLLPVKFITHESPI
jgi:hypothetical protein